MKVSSIAVVLVLAPALAFAGFHGRVSSTDGDGITGALVSARHDGLARTTTVYADEQGRYRMPELPEGIYELEAAAFGYRKTKRARVEASGTVNLVLERETDTYERLARLPANRWLAVLLAEMPDDGMRTDFKQQCAFCHQQGNWATRVGRDPREWEKILDLMARMGGILDAETREALPRLINEAYAEAHALPALERQLDEHPVRSPAGLSAVVDEWEMGDRASFNHDVVVGRDGAVWTVDMTQDFLRRLDPVTGEREAFKIPGAGLPLGGVFPMAPLPSNADARVGPHSLQVAPDGRIWTTLALGNKIGIFEPETASWTLVDQPKGYYPHTLRFDAEGRGWYTVALSNHLAMLDPKTGAHEMIRLPSRTWAQAIGARLMPAIELLGEWFTPPTSMPKSALPPTPYGIDVGPDGGIWFSQLNVERIGRYDPETGAIEVFDTPFPGPRRLRFDGDGNLWVPGFSSSVIMRFDPRTKEFRSWRLPIEPAGTEVPYALNVHPETGEVWVCGTNSDTLIRFRPGSEEWTVYPLPTLVTYTREIDFDEKGGVWTSNSNLPGWQIEARAPSIVRLRPEGAPPPPVAVADAGS